MVVGFTDEMAGAASGDMVGTAGCAAGSTTATGVLDVTGCGGGSDLVGRVTIWAGLGVAVTTAGVCVGGGGGPSVTVCDSGVGGHDVTASDSDSSGAGRGIDDIGRLLTVDTTSLLATAALVLDTAVTVLVLPDVVAAAAAAREFAATDHSVGGHDPEEYCWD